MTPTARIGGRAGRGIPLLSIMLLLASGCMHQQLQFIAGRTANTLPDLQYQQVMDNLAMIAANPGFLPYLAVAGQGSIQVTDGGTSSLSLNLAPKTWTSGIFGLGASRNITGTWSLGTITSPEKIRGMQTAYQQAVRGSAQGDPAYVWLKIGRTKGRSQACELRGSPRPSLRLGFAGWDRRPLRTDPRDHGHRHPPRHGSSPGRAIPRNGR